MVDSTLLGASTSLDNLTVGLSLGLTGKGIPTSLNVQIAVANAVVMAVAMAGGELVSDALPMWVASVLPGLVCIGLGILASSEFFFDMCGPVPAAIRQPVRDDAQEQTALVRIGEEPYQPVDAQIQNQVALFEKIDFTSVRATVPLTLGLCINNAGGGVAAGIANMDIALVSTMVGLFSIGFFAGGLFGGQMVRSSAMRVNLRSSYVSLAAGSLLVMLGVSQLTGA